MSVEFKLTDIPAGDVDEVVEDFEGEGCTVVKVPQTDGTFTVTATCPEK